MSRNGSLSINHPRNGEAHVMSGVEAPSSVDWRKTLVLPVKTKNNAGHAGLSPRLSPSRTVRQAPKNLLSMSEQDLVDCVKKVKVPGSSEVCCDGCEGGLMDYAFQYMIDSQSGTDDKESSYRYTARNGRCKFEKSEAFRDAKITKYTDITKGSESELMDATANVGPISVAVNAND
eukprot:UN03480